MKQLKKKHANADGLDEKNETTNATCKKEQWAQGDKSWHYVLFQHESNQDHMMNFPQFDSQKPCHNLQGPNNPTTHQEITKMHTQRHH
jgi:hypothetical protein